ncbi:MAG: NERD domain-containing protein, partial [Nitrospira defluvii]|nr:NERD domain-containing protein [Nitrospira defluvii]
MGEVLDLLREKGYRVFHDILGPNFNIDHVLVGSAGIFTIETKTRSKPLHADPKIFYDGQAIRIENEHPFDEPLVQARAQARWLTMVLNDGRAIPFTVRPVVVFPGWFIERIGSKSNCDVWVLNPKALGAFLANEPRILTPALIDS